MADNGVSRWELKYIGYNRLGFCLWFRVNFGIEYPNNTVVNNHQHAQTIQQGARGWVGKRGWVCDGQMQAQKMIAVEGRRVGVLTRWARNGVRATRGSQGSHHPVRKVSLSSLQDRHMSVSVSATGCSKKTYEVFTTR